MRKIVLLMSVLASGVIFASVEDGLVAHYEFSDNVKDSSGQGNDGKAYGVEIVADRNGNELSACRFDGKSSYVKIDAAKVLDSVKESVTVSAWIKPTAWHPGFYMPIVCKGYSTRFYGLMIYGRGNRWLKDEEHESCFELCRLKYEDDEFVRAYSDAKIELGCWQHVAITYGDGIVRAYVNGRLVGKHEVKASLLSGSSPMFVGSDPDGSPEYFKGDMDDLRVYNRRLTSEEIEDLYEGDVNWFAAMVRVVKRCFCSPAE